MKRALWLVALLLCVAALGACGGREEPLTPQSGEYRLQGNTGVTLLLRLEKDGYARDGFFLGVASPLSSHYFGNESSEERAAVRQKNGKLTLAASDPEETYVFSIVSDTELSYLAEESSPYSDSVSYALKDGDTFLLSQQSQQPS